MSLVIQIWVYRCVIDGHAYVLFCLRRQKSTKRTPPRASALWKPVWALWVCLTEHIHGSVQNIRSAEACGDEYFERSRTQPKVDARPPLPLVFILRRNTRPPYVKRRTCRMIAWGVPTQTALCFLKVTVLPPSNHAPSGRERQGTERWSPLRRHLGFMANCDLTAHKHSAQRNSARTAGGWIPKEGTVGTFLRGRSFGTFLSARREKYTNNQKNQNFINS